MSLKKLFLVAMFVAVVAVFGASTVQADPLPKITICHIPPGNPANWHTITISENALPAHYDNHGDFPGNCSANCEELCDDSDPCTIDVDQEAEDCVCLVERVPVDCGPITACAAVSCDPESGCLSTPTICDDFNECTADTCSESYSGCIYAPLDDGTPCGDGQSCNSGVCGEAPPQM